MTAGSADGGTEGSTIDRRKALAASAAIATTVWVAPAILQTDVAGAQATGPSGGNGILAGLVARCNPTFPLDVDEQYSIIAELVSDGTLTDTTTPMGPAPAGNYSMSLPAGIYTVYFGPSDESLPAEEVNGVVITSGATTTLDYGFVGQGC